MAPPRALASLPMVPGISLGRTRPAKIQFIQLVVDVFRQLDDDRVGKRTVNHDSFEVDGAGRSANGDGKRRRGGVDPLGEGSARFQRRLETAPPGLKVVPRFEDRVGSRAIARPADSGMRKRMSCTVR